MFAEAGAVAFNAPPLGFVFWNVQEDYIIPGQPKLRPLEERAIYNENGVVYRSLDLRLHRLVTFKIKRLPHVGSITVRSEWFKK